MKYTFLDYLNSEEGHDTLFGFTEESAVVVYGYHHDEKLDKDVLATDAIKKIKNVGFNVLKYTYNPMTFGAALDQVRTDFIAINPYINLTSIPEPVKPKYRPCVFEKLQGYIASEAEIEDACNLGELDSDDRWLWQHLANGWTTKSCMGYLAKGENRKYDYYRPAGSMPIDGRATEVILHHLHPRPMSSEELSICYSDTFPQFVDEFIAACPLLDQPNYFWSAAHDIQWSHKPREHNTQYTYKEQSPFNWIDCVQQRAKVKPLKEVPQAELNIYSIPTWKGE